MGIGVPEAEIDSVARSIGCSTGSFPFKFLGVPVGASMSKCAQWEPIINKFKTRLSHWNATMLSYGGRLVLTRSVLGSLGVYFFSLYKAPESVLKKLEALRCRFFWGMKPDRKGITWIAWNDVLASRNTGGLGINSLKAQNLSLLSKWWWRFKTSENGLWKAAITGFHGQDGALPSTLASLHNKIGGVWGTIAGIHKKLSPLNINLPALFSHSCITIGGLTTWKWSWVPNSSGEFTAASLRFLIDSYLLKNDKGLVTKWRASLPSKVNILIWRIQHQRLPTRVNISARGIDIGTSMCPLCDKEAETEDHLFFRCDFSRLALRVVFNWWGIIPVDSWSFNDIFTGSFTSLSERNLSIFHAVICVHLWAIWNARNDKVFSNKLEVWTRIPDKVQNQSFFWLNSRRKKDSKIQWSSWCCNPQNM